MVVIIVLYKIGILKVNDSIFKKIFMLCFKYYTIIILNVFLFCLFHAISIIMTMNCVCFCQNKKSSDLSCPIMSCHILSGYVLFCSIRFCIPFYYDRSGFNWFMVIKEKNWTSCLKINMKHSH